MEIKKMYINGQWTQGSPGTTSDVVNPFNGDILCRIWESSIEDTREAIKAAKNAFYTTREWRDMDVEARSRVLLKVAQLIEENQEEMAAMETQNMGKPLRESLIDIADGAGTFRYYAGLIQAPQGGVCSVSNSSGEIHSITVREPVGVCAQITPWNYPFTMAAWKLAPALAAGNTVVFKPSHKTPLTTIRLFELLEEAGLPKGPAKLVLGGSAIGCELGESMDVDMLTFTGSTKVGQSLQRLAAGNMKKLGFELGGKSPNVIFADADIDGAVEWAMMGIFYNQGEVCSSGSRIFVEDSVKDEFMEKFVKKTKALTLGDPMKDPDMGPLVTKEHMDRVLEYIKIGRDEGAKVVCGGERYTDGECADGYFVLPTIFDQCSPDMRIVREEIFGPVATVQSFSSEKEAVAMANDTCYGLAGAVFTSDSAKAMRVIKEIRAGITWINCYNLGYNQTPWGGYKMSGTGRELGIYGLEEYQEVKQIHMNLNPGPVGWYVNS